MDSLLRCPFCGGEVYVAKIEPRLYRPSCNHPYSVVCYNCDLFFGYDGDYGGEYDTEAEAIEAWNRRFVTDTNVGSKERTAKVTDTWIVAGYDELNAWCPVCEHRITRGCSFCPTCGVKLEWSGNE